MTKFTRYLWLAIMLLGPLPHAVAQNSPVPTRMQKYALLVGVNKYSGSLGKLAFCHNDMNALKIRLLAAGFPAENVVFLNEDEEDANLYPSKANIEAQLRLRMSIASKNDLFLVAFSGHGLHIDGKSYYCPIDAKIDDPAGSMVAVDDIYAGLQNCKAAQRLMVIDACRNDPTRGLKAARSGDFSLAKPPTGVRVLSSCEAGQYSMEDPKLKHGVFMYYVTKGLEGAADLEVEGNKNGKITLDELYYFAHEKTKMHVANSYVLPQTPVLRGEVVGPFELALVPDREKLERELLKADEKSRLASVEGIKPPPATGEITESKTSPASQTPSQAAPSPMNASPAPQARDLSHPLLTQGNIYFQQGDYDNAVNAFTALIEDSEAPVTVRKQARLGRGSAYLAQGGRENVHKALTDQKAAGLKSVSMTITKASSNLMVNSQVTGAVKQNEVVDISVINGEWLWVAAVNGNSAKTGYIKWDAVLGPPPAAAAAPVAAAGVQPQQQAANFQPQFQNQGTMRAAGTNFQSGRSYNDTYRETPGLKAEYRAYDTESNKLDRLYNRNASDSAIRTQERKVEQHERRIDRMESRGGRNR